MHACVNILFIGVPVCPEEKESVSGGYKDYSQGGLASAGDDTALMVRAISDVVSEMISRYERGKEIDVRKLKNTCASRVGLKRSPKLVDIIAAIPEQYRKAFQPLVTAKPIRSASGISVVAVMCKPHRCPHIAMTGNICVVSCGRTGHCLCAACLRAVLLAPL